jgi:hypothetical protein
MRRSQVERVGLEDQITVRVWDEAGEQGSKVKEKEFKSLNDLWEYMISQVGWTEALSGDEAMGESHLFATFFHSLRRGRDTYG